MRIFYAGPLGKGSTCLYRAEALESLGHELVRFDTTPFISSGGRIRRGIQHRLLFGPDLYALNKHIQAAFAGHRSIDIVWLDKARWIFPETLTCFRSVSACKLIHFTPDAAFHYRAYKSRHFRRSLCLYDLCLTTKEYELEKYMEFGAKNVLFAPQGVDARFASTSSCSETGSAKREGAVFIGRAEPHYRRVLSSLVERGISLRIWGNEWEKLRHREPVLSPCIEGAGLWGDSYVSALASAKIGIGLLSKFVPDSYTTRTFEIPAAGAMLIAERTAKHKEFFEEGVEAEFFSSEEELADKVRFYLANDQLRIKIASAGRMKVMSRFSWSQVLSPAFIQII